MTGIWRPAAEVYYGLAHLVCVFWVPLLVTLTCYVILCVLLIPLTRQSFV